MRFGRIDHIPAAFRGADSGRVVNKEEPFIPHRSLNSLGWPTGGTINNIPKRSLANTYCIAPGLSKENVYLHRFIRL